MACDSDTESAACYSSGDIRVWVLLCVSCWNGKKCYIRTRRDRYDHCVSLPWYKTLTTYAGPCHTYLTPRLNPSNFQRVAMKWRSPAVCLVLAASLAASQPTGQKAKDAAFWKETPMDGVVQEFQTKCAQRNDHASCLKFKVLNLLDEMFRRDSFKVSKRSSVNAIFIRPS